MLTDVAHEFSLSVRKRGEDASGDDITLDLRESQARPIEPGSVDSIEVQVNLGMSFNRLAFVGGESLGDHGSLCCVANVDEIAK